MGKFSFFLGQRMQDGWLLDFLQNGIINGIGAVLAFPIFDAAVKIFEEMATFQEAGISVGNEKGFDPETEAKVFNEFWKRRF